MNVLDLLLIPLYLPIHIIECIYIYSINTYRYYENKDKLRKSGYNVDPPVEYFFHPERYSVYTRHKWSPTTYTKYGRTYTYEEIINGALKVDK